MAGALVGVLALSLVFPMSAGAAVSSGHPGGLSANPLLGPLSAKWWRWIAEQPAPSNPFLSTDGKNCGQGQGSGAVFFLAGTFVGPVTRNECEVPHGKAIFFPIVNIATIKTIEGETSQDLWKQVQVDAGWKVVSANVWVDGKRLPGVSARNLLNRGCVGPERGCAPKSFAIDLPEDNIFGVANPIYELAVADGYYALIPPLRRGDHEIRWEGSANYGDGSFTQSVVYNIVVV